MRRLLALALVVAPLSAADEIYLESGRKVSGVVVERTARMLIVDVGPGRVGFPLSSVKRVVSADSDLSAFRGRADRLRPDDVAGWVELGHWARERNLETQARESYERALRADPNNAAANHGLGREYADGRWLAFAERQQARGLVEFEGEWMSPGQREAREAAEDANRRARRAEARARAAEAEAAEAEGRAREAEARAHEAEEDDGLPVWGWGGGWGGGSVCRVNCQPGCPCIDTPGPPAPRDPPAVAVKPPSTGLVSPQARPEPRSSQGLSSPRR